MKYYIISGEASGDLHGSNLVKGLVKKDSDASFRFWGGDRMAEACGDKGTMVCHYKDAAVMGVVEVVMKARSIKRRMDLCRKDIVEWNPDVVILIDYPGFNLKIAEFAKGKGFKVFYYIAPKLWARGESRIRKIRKYVDGLYIIFPFEIEYFKKLGVNPQYFGNPLLDSIANYPYGKVCNPEKPSIALLAGSRSMEIKYLMPRFVALEKLMDKDEKWKDYQLIVAAAPSTEIEVYRRYMPADSSIHIVSGDTYSVLKQSAAAVISSGTASLEAALIGTPQVVCYGFNEVTYWLAKLFVKVKYVSLANLIIDKWIFKELIQHDAAPEKILKELNELVFNNEYRAAMKQDYESVRVALGGEGASERVAENMILSLKSK